LSEARAEQERLSASAPGRKKEKKKWSLCDIEKRENSDDETTAIKREISSLKLGTTAEQEHRLEK